MLLIAPTPVALILAGSRGIPMNNSKAQWRRYVLPAAALMGAGLPFADSAQAQPAQGAGAGAQGDVVITARKKAESLQKVPVAVTVQTSKDLETKSIRQVSDLGAFTPSLTTAQPTAT